MIKFLMLGSSHSACFKKLVLPESVGLSIFANAGAGLFQNLSFADNGDFFISDNASSWDQKVFKMSGDGASQNINSYDYLILNISFPLDLPMVFHGDRDKNSVEHMILAASSTLCSTILSDHFSKVPNIQRTKRLLDAITNLGFQRRNIFVLPTPFSCAKFNSESQMHGDDTLGKPLLKKIKSIFNQSQSIAKNDHSISLVMPDVQMLEIGMFLKSSFSTPDSSTNWKNFSGRNFRPADRVHKNSSYGKTMFSRVLDSLS